MPNDVVLKGANAVHRAMLKVTGGRFGWHLADMPVLELTTIGRKSGTSRSVMLTSPHQDGERVVVVASRGGDDHHPAWFLNLRDNPDVEVAMQGRPAEKWRATVATDEERAELWPVITSRYDNYAGYQSKTDRQIPLVFLEPIG